MGIKSDQLAVEEFQMVAEFKSDMISDTIDLQDDETQRVVLDVYKVLCDHATAEVKVGTSMVAPEQASIRQSLLWLAYQIVADLGALGIRVANYQFNPGLCVVCSAEIGE